MVASMTDTPYFPTYAIPADLPEVDARWLAEQQGDGPLELADVTDVCVMLQVSATLYDALGRIRGSADERGDCQLTSSAAKSPAAADTARGP
jgi:hypothetical protein